MRSAEHLSLRVGAPARKLAYYELPGSPPRRFFYYKPANYCEAAPLVVSVHGISRNAAAHAYRLMIHAEHFGAAVMAPLFSKKDYGQYQQLIDASSGVRADLALLDAIDAAGRLSHARTDKVILFGFSGGAQFTHRFVFAHPHRVLSAAHVAAGWYTWPTADGAYPQGLASDSHAIAFDLAAALCVPQHLMVGEHDVERDASLRRSKSIDRNQGRTRVERAKSWRRAMCRAAQAHANGRCPTLTILPGVAHSFIEAVETANLLDIAFDRFVEDGCLTPINELREIER